MKILLYAESDCLQAMTLEKRMLSGMPGTDIVRIVRQDSLAKQLSRPMNNISVVLAFVPSASLLRSLKEAKGLLDNKKLILILDRKKKELRAASLELGPSFVSDLDRDLTDVLLVLNQIRQKQFMARKMSAL